MDVQVPQVRGVPGYHSPLMAFLADHSEVLERLVAEMYARGLSTRDVEDAFTDATGHCLLIRNREHTSHIHRPAGEADVDYELSFWARGGAASGPRRPPLNAALNPQPATPRSALHPCARPPRRW